MIGYWRNGQRPVTTTGNNFLENFVFFVPSSGIGLVLIILIPFFIFSGLIHPHYEYTFSDYNHSVTIEYQRWTMGNQVNGKIQHYWSENDRTYNFETAFKGYIQGNQIIVQVNKTNVTSGGMTQYNVGKELTFYLEGDKVIYDGITTDGGRQLFSLPWIKNDYKF